MLFSHSYVQFFNTNHISFQNADVNIIRQHQTMVSFIANVIFYVGQRKGNLTKQAVTNRTNSWRRKPSFELQGIKTTELDSLCCETTTQRTSISALAELLNIYRLFSCCCCLATFVAFKLQSVGGELRFY